MRQTPYRYVPAGYKLAIRSSNIWSDGFTIYKKVLMKISEDIREPVKISGHDALGIYTNISLIFQPIGWF